LDTGKLTFIQHSFDKGAMSGVKTQEIMNDYAAVTSAENCIQLQYATRSKF